MLYSNIRLANYSSHRYSITEIMTMNTLILLMNGTVMLDWTDGFVEMIGIVNGLTRFLDAMVEIFN